MSRSYRFSPEHGYNDGRQNNRRGDRRARRIMEEIAAQVDAFVVPQTAQFSIAGGFRQPGRQQNSPARSVARRG